MFNLIIKICDENKNYHIKIACFAPSHFIEGGWSEMSEMLQFSQVLKFPKAQGFS